MDKKIAETINRYLGDKKSINEVKEVDAAEYEKIQDEADKLEKKLEVALVKKAKEAWSEEYRTGDGRNFKNIPAKLLYKNGFSEKEVDRFAELLKMLDNWTDWKIIKKPDGTITLVDKVNG